MSARYLSHCCALCAVVLWSSAYVFTKVALASFTPATLAFLRCAVAALALLCVAARRAKGSCRALDWPVFLLSGVLGFSLVSLAVQHGTGRSDRRHELRSDLHRALDHGGHGGRAAA